MRQCTSEASRAHVSGRPQVNNRGETGGERAQDGEGEYLRHTECNVFKIVTQIVLLVRFEGSSPTILKGK